MAGGPFVVGAVVVVGGILVGVEVYGAFENLQRGKEGLGPVYPGLDGGMDWYPFGGDPDSPPPRS